MCRSKFVSGLVQSDLTLWYIPLNRDTQFDRFGPLQIIIEEIYRVRDTNHKTLVRCVHLDS